MRFFLLPFLLIVSLSLQGQNCTDAEMGDVQYQIRYEEELREVHDYLVPCSQMDFLSIDFPDDFYHPGPDPGTEPGIFIFVLKEIPVSDVSADDFISLLYRDVSGDPVYFYRSEPRIDVDDLMTIRDRIGSFFLLPVLVSNRKATTLESFFESACIPHFPENALQILDNLKNNFEFSRFDEVFFTQWPEDISILEFFDIEFRDVDTDKNIPFTPIDHRTLKLHFPREQGVLHLYVNWKDYACYDVEYNEDWAFPEPTFILDSVDGFQNIEKCIPVRVRDFQSVTGFTLPFHWDRDSLEYAGISNIHPLLAPHLQVVEMEDDEDFSQMKVVMPADVDSIDLPDDAVLFEWCGKPLSGAGTRVTILPGGEEEFEVLIYGFSAGFNHSPGQIRVQEDREIDYELTQLCNTRDGKNRLQLILSGDKAFPYQLSFHSDEVEDTVIHEPIFLIAHVPQGIYEFTIRDSFGFEKGERFEVVDFIPPDFELNIEEDFSRNPDCLHPAGGVISVSVSEDGDFYFDLPDYPERNFEGDSIIGLTHGLYVIRAEDEKGCIDTISYRLVPPAEIEVEWDTDLVFCPDDREISFILNEVSEESDSSLEYQIDGGSVFYPGEEVVLKSPGEHKITLWNRDGCSLDTVLMVKAAPQEMAMFDSVMIEVQAGEEIFVSSGEEFSEGRIRWIFEGENVGQDPDLVFVPAHSGILNFDAKLYGRCIYQDSVWVQVVSLKDELLPNVFPNAFSPNGDGENDYFKLFPTAEIQEIITVQVYDRYGSFVYEEKYENDPIGWNGMIGQQEAPPGTYAVIVDFVRRDGRSAQAMFDLLLVR